MVMALSCTYICYRVYTYCTYVRRCIYVGALDCYYSFSDIIHYMKAIGILNFYAYVTVHSDCCIDSIVYSAMRGCKEEIFNELLSQTLSRLKL